MRKKVTIIIPTYNEALIIEETIHQVFDAVQIVNNYDVNVLIFDSASRDETQDIVRKLQSDYPKLYLQTETQKSGLGSAYHAAMRYAMDELGADIVVEFDADLSHQPKYLVPMLDKMAQYDVVMGSRYVPGGSIPADWGWHRKLLSRFGSAIAGLFLTNRYKDFTSGFRATRTSVLRKILPYRFISSDFAYKLELLWLLHLSGATVVELPIEFIDRSKGSSKLRANSILDSMRVLLQLRFGKFAQYGRMCLVGLVGMVTQIVIYNASRLLINPFFAAQIAVTGALVNNYFLHNRITFKNTRPFSLSSSRKTLFNYAIWSCLTIYVQTCWLKITVDFIGTGHWKENMMLISGILLGSVLNYLAYSKVVWKKSNA